MGISDPELFTVDSRAYAYAHFIREPGDVPADFPAALTSRFSIGIFLPQEQVGRFNEPAFPARVLLLADHEDKLTLHVHPSLNEPPLRIAMRNVRVVNQSRFLLDCRFGFDLVGGSCDIPYNGRDEEAVSRFLRNLRGRLLSASYGNPGVAATLHCGDPLSFKFAGYEHEELVEGETVCARFFIASQPTRVRHWLGSAQGWTPADSLAVTDRRLLWMTDRDGEYRQPFGIRCSFSPATFLGDITFHDGILQIHVANEITWSLQLPPRHISAARKFGEAVRSHRSHWA